MLFTIWLCYEWALIEYISEFGFYYFIYYGIKDQKKSWHHALTHSTLCAQARRLRFEINARTQLHAPLQTEPLYQSPSPKEQKTKTRRRKKYRY